MNMQSVNEASVGIIGGADGPTAVLVSGELPLFVVACGVGLLVAIAVIVILSLKKRK